MEVDVGVAFVEEGVVAGENIDTCTRTVVPLVVQACRFVVEDSCETLEALVRAPALGRSVSFLHYTEDSMKHDWVEWPTPACPGDADDGAESFVEAGAGAGAGVVAAEDAVTVVRLPDARLTRHRSHPS